MYFGEYLLREKIISEKQLIDGLLQQLDETPSLLSILYNELGVSDKKILEVTKELIEGKVDLFSLQQTKKSFDDQIFRQGIELQKERRVQLGQILVGQGCFSWDDLEKHLSDYFAQTSQKHEAQGETSAESTGAGDDSGDPFSGISAAALESLRELGTLDDDLLRELQQLSAKS
jgi:hypothetical protein